MLGLRVYQGREGRKGDGVHGPLGKRGVFAPCKLGHSSPESTKASWDKREIKVFGT